MSEYLKFGDIPFEIEPHPLLPSGVVFDTSDHPAITNWGDCLPPVDFSAQQYEHVQDLTNGNITLFDGWEVVALAKYLAPKLKFGESLGCWDLPLPANRDANGQSRYPLVNLACLKYRGQVAHRATLETFRGIPLPRNEDRNKHVDHRCRNQACCNPYHLELVNHATNVRRGAIARKRDNQNELIQLPRNQNLTFRDISAILNVARVD